jgi:hypothetical protein
MGRQRRKRHERVRRADVGVDRGQSPGSAGSTKHRCRPRGPPNNRQHRGEQRHAVQRQPAGIAIQCRIVVSTDEPLAVGGDQDAADGETEPGIRRTPAHSDARPPPSARPESRPRAHPCPGGPSTRPPRRGGPRRRWHWTPCRPRFAEACRQDFDGSCRNGGDEVDRVERRHAEAEDASHAEGSGDRPGSLAGLCAEDWGFTWNARARACFTWNIEFGLWAAPEPLPEVCRWAYDFAPLFALQPEADL